MTIATRLPSMQAEGKTLARQIVLAMARGEDPTIHSRIQPAASVLDLWGGGQSARMFRQALPNAAVISVERDPTQWPHLVQDAQLNGYGYHLGDVREVRGVYDFAWYDSCGPLSRIYKEDLSHIAQIVQPKGVIAATVMPERDVDPLLPGPDRLQLTAFSLEQLTKRKVAVWWPYRRQSGQTMWLFVLGRVPGWDDGVLAEELEERGFWSLHVGFEHWLDYALLTYQGKECPCQQSTRREGHRWQG